MLGVYNITPMVSQNARNMIFSLLGFVVQKMDLFLLLHMVFRYIRTLPVYGAYTQSSC